MPRKGPPPRRELMPDPIYRSVLVTQFVNKVLVRGKRSTVIAATLTTHVSLTSQARGDAMKHVSLWPLTCGEWKRATRCGTARDTRARTRFRVA